METPLPPIYLSLRRSECAAEAMTALSFPTQDVSIRRIALPAEHGGWGIVLEPVVLGLIIAPSVAGFFIGLAALLTFLARQPFKIASGDLLVRRRRFPRTSPAVLFTVAFGAGAAAFLAAAAVMGTGVIALVPIAIAAPLAAIQISHDIRNTSRSLLPELSGAVAMSASVAAILLAAGATWPVALAAWMIIATRSITAIIYIRARLRREQGREWSAVPTIATHGTALGGMIVAAQAGVAPWLGSFAFLLLAGRAIVGLRRVIDRPDPRRVGWTEIVWGVVTIVLVGTAYRLGI